MSETNFVATLLKVLGVFVLLGGFAVGVLARELMLFIVYGTAGFISAVMFFAFAEVIQLLTDIKNK